MSFSVVDEMHVLFSQWKVTSVQGLAGSIIAVFSLAVLYEFMGTLHSYLDLPASKRYTTRTSFSDKRLQDHILRTCAYLLSAAAGYMLMLVVGNLDVWLFLSIIVGAGVGYFLSNPLYTWYHSMEVHSTYRRKRGTRNINNKTFAR